ncbi:beta-ketoacyl-[acyl-carrier-protein] synthase family protein [Flavitalea sp. BT771]|uniref:beta-ketoacyl-[acyl-carrier-protein] synthase family protein n=1 Tax=Flavitalea sp. BT771 TaxID=3063329 RepID=UPI0026E44278|nr:beta-ketoacyl-[acyl-carrier-protein] synthase family protein [Flavitalea sp. BT771]MDO6429978.1 beta-ketoacyl-[acyl-carrier-protein] synthase family protein [Flavitalea sp. BT771]MDV6217894.1 beta-ketoacyl-[acyl-carrier-protein] synthase family protein [Flavitalea sp. BT771]
MAMSANNKSVYIANKPIYIAGLGLISAIGNDVAKNLHALENGQAGMQALQHLDTVHRSAFPVAEVKASNEELATLTGLTDDDGRPPVNISRTALLSLVAAKEALESSGLQIRGGTSRSQRRQLRLGLVSANTVGGMDKTEHFFRHFLNDPQKGRLSEVIHHECGSITEWVADQLGIHEYITTINTACSSSANALAFAARLIRHGYLDAVVAGGTDSLTKFTLNGFNTLMILDREYCTPFDEDRKGLNLGEGAGYVVLVSEQIAATLQSTPFCRLSGYCNRNDAYHQTASSPDGRGSYLAMLGALESSGLQPSDIDYINLHGTGTTNNDLAEGLAIQRLFDPKYPPLSSTKSFTGHTLGASGGIEAVFSALSVQKDIIYPNLRFQTPMKELSFTPETSLVKDKPVKHVLSNSFGFGGNCSSLIFSKP